MKTVYLRVTKDKFELPTAVALSVVEMSRITGKTENNISSQISKRKLYGQKGEFISVEIDEDEVEE